MNEKLRGMPPITLLARPHLIGWRVAPKRVAPKVLYLYTSIMSNSVVSVSSVRNKRTF